MNNGLSTAVYDSGSWKITLQPQHAILFKRVFDGVEKDGQVLKLSDTPKHARDLLWFAERHPIVFDPLMRLLAQAELQTEREKSVERILGAEYIPSNPQLALPLRDYQARAGDLAFANGGLLLADSMGLGKTASAIGLFARREALPAVVVTLTSLPLQWRDQIKKFAPDLRSHVVKSTQPYRLDLVKGQRVPLPDVTVMSYSKLTTKAGRSWVEKLTDEGMVRTVIFDEGQELRNNDSNRYRAARNLRESSAYCMITSGTPIYNHGGEIYNVSDIAQPSSLGTRSEFLREWCGRSDTEESLQRNGTGEMRKIRVNDPIALGNHLREIGVMLRRTREDVGRELPPLQRVKHTVDIDQSVFDETAASIEKLCNALVYSNNRTERFTAAGELDWQMRRATGLAKAMHVAHFVRMMVENGEPVVLFGWHHEVYELWRKLFSSPDLGDLRPAFFTGRESAATKDRERRRFLEGDTKIFIMSLRAGAGLDGLQDICKTCVFGELDWAPGVHQQCEARVFRDGQRHPVIVYYLVTDEGSDPVVLDVLNLKTEQSEGISNLTSEVAILKGGEDHMRKVAQAYLRRKGKLH